MKIDNFKGWENENPEDFFKEVESMEDIDEKTNDESSDDEDDEDNFFKDTTEADDEKNSEEDVENEDANKEDSEKSEEDEEDKIEQLVEQKVEDLFKELPETLKDINKYVLNGGSLEDILNMLISKDDFNEEQLKDIVGQKQMMRHFLKNDGYEDDDIETMLDTLESTEKLEKTVKSRYKKWELDKEKSKKETLEKQEESLKLLKEQEKKEKAEFKTTLATYDKNLTKDITEFVYDKNISLTSGAKITEYQKILYYDIPKNKEALAQLSVLLKNRKEDGTFDFSIFKEKEENVKRKESNKNLRRVPQKRIADYFN